MSTFMILPTILSFPAYAQLDSIKKTLLMPGPLIEGHAEEEDNCDACHTRFDKAGQDTLCIECHEEVEADQSADRGFHGKNPLASKASCNSCHKDHLGREFDNVPLDPDTFDHTHTDFPLTGKHEGATCSACHQADEKLRDAAGECSSCHDSDNPHDSAMGNECATCHSTSDWREKQDFDHDSTDFPLRGEHQSLNCASCHGGERYQFESTGCVTCHALRDAHRGRLGTSCSDCHGEESWTETDFNHSTDTKFKLTGKHEQLACTACHHEANVSLETTSTCNDCHSTQDSHGGRHGTDCANCHSTRDWTISVFDHQQASDWALPAGHTELRCLQCHQGALDEQTGNTCRDCHQLDNVHGNEDIGNCNLCHDPRSWEGSPGFNHELTRFPLEGLHAIAPCASCHSDHRYSATATGCVDCHRAEDTHNSALGENCGQCHTPNGWDLWLFDHQRDTEFELGPAHAGIDCHSCHKDPDTVPLRECRSCHSDDDRHAGAFGSNCKTCHRGESFGEITWPK